MVSTANRFAVQERRHANMNRINCTRRLEFDYGHRLLNHESKCAHVHGHRGVLEVTVSAPGPDKAGRCVDFGVIKALVGGWVDENLDHAFLVNAEDVVMVKFLDSQNQRRLAMDCEPSAENIALMMHGVASALFKRDPAHHQLKVERVRFYETPNGWADYP